MNTEELANIVEAVLLASDQPLDVNRLLELFDADVQPSKKDIRDAIKVIDQRMSERSIELKEVATGWRIQVRQDYSSWIGKLWAAKPPRYSRALLETLAIMVYRQPITRSEIEEIRGVAVSQNIVKTLLEREWVKVVGNKEVPGRPALFGTTKQFLDDFNLKSLDQLPTLPEIKDVDSLSEVIEKLQPTPQELEADDVLNPGSENEQDEENNAGQDGEGQPEESESADGSAEEDLSEKIADEGAAPENITRH